MIKPFEAIFISDLHLSENCPEITQKFEQFLLWARDKTDTLYILGDFFHAWAGDDACSTFDNYIADCLLTFKKNKKRIFFMAGNRDFLIGKTYLKRAGMTYLKDPTVIEIEGQCILLSHGDSYCQNDKRHQCFRKVTQHPWFRALFLKLPCYMRKKFVTSVRKISEKRMQMASDFRVEILPSSYLPTMSEKNCTVLIHGHIHQSGVIETIAHQQCYRRYILSDWDDKPVALCYSKPGGFYFSHFY